MLKQSAPTLRLRLTQGTSDRRVCLFKSPPSSASESHAADNLFVCMRVCVWACFLPLSVRRLTCKQWANEGKCSKDFLVGYCCSSCHDCDPSCEATTPGTTSAAPTLPANYTTPPIITTPRATPIVNTTPDILFILADDLGFNDVSIHGHSQVETPNIDAIGKNGLHMLNYHVPPVCTPSRLATLTGRHMMHVGVYLPDGVDESREIRTDFKFLPEYLKSCCNYSTHMVGKWHVGFNKMSALPTARGFDDFHGIYNGAGDHWEHTFRGSFDYHSEEKDDNGSVTITHLTELDGDFAGNIVTDQAVKLIEAHGPRDQRENPWFMLVAYQNPHWPLQAPIDYIDMYAGTTGGGTGYRARQLVLALTKHMDDAVGTIVQALKDNGAYDDTIIIFTSDHGGPTNMHESTENNNYPLRGGKNTLWEGGTRTVGLVQGPGIPAAPESVRSHFVASDWLLTLVAAARNITDESTDVLAGLFDQNESAPFELGDGINQWGFLRSGGNESASRRDWVLHATTTPTGDSPFGKAITVGRYKLVQVDDSTSSNPDTQNGWFTPPGAGGQAHRDPSLYAIGCPAFEDDMLRKGEAPNLQQCTSTWCLFDMETDPCEYYDLADDLPDVVTELVTYFQQYKATAIDELDPVEGECSAPITIRQSGMDVWEPCDYEAALVPTTPTIPTNSTTMSATTTASTTSATTTASTTSATTTAPTTTTATTTSMTTTTVTTTKTTLRLTTTVADDETTAAGPGNSAQLPASSLSTTTWSIAGAGVIGVVGVAVTIVLVLRANGNKGPKTVPHRATSSRPPQGDTPEATETTPKVIGEKCSAPSADTPVDAHSAHV